MTARVRKALATALLVVRVWLVAAGAVAWRVMFQRWQEAAARRRAGR